VKAPQARRFLNSSFSMIFRLRRNRTWPLTDLHNRLPRMAKRKTKRNAGRSLAYRRFKIRQGPTVHATKQTSLPDVNDRVTPTRMCGQPSLFAIARDPRTIFASWNINWRAVFEEAMPADRQVHLRVINREGVIEDRVAVEPMSAMHYVTISGLHNSYRVEIGYFLPFDTWHSVATSGEVDIDLATVPFHLSFQQIADLFGENNNTSVATLVSDFQKRVLSCDSPNETTASDRQILSSMNLSLPGIASAYRDFRKIDTEKLTRRARAIASTVATSSGALIRSETSWS